MLQVLLGLVLDIKNNRQRSQGTGGPLTISSVLSAGVLKWLRGCGIDEVQLRNLTWQMVLQPNKKVHFKCSSSSRNTSHNLCRSQKQSTSLMQCICAASVEPFSGKTSAEISQGMSIWA